MKHEKVSVLIKFDVKLSLWSAIKMRIAGIKNVHKIYFESFDRRGNKSKITFECGDDKQEITMSEELIKETIRRK